MKINKNIGPNSFVTRVRLNVKELGLNAATEWTTISINPGLEALIRAVFNIPSKERIRNFILETIKLYFNKEEYQKLSGFLSNSSYITYLITKRLADHLGKRETFDNNFSLIPLMQLRTSKRIGILEGVKDDIRES